MNVNFIKAHALSAASQAAQARIIANDLRNETYSSSSANVHRVDRERVEYGFLVIHDGEVSGWCRGLNEPRAWVPGCFAVEMPYARKVFISKGGTEYFGAERWEAIL